MTFRSGVGLVALLACCVVANVRQAQSLSADAVAQINNLLLRSAELGNAYREVSGAATQFSDALRFGQQVQNGERPKPLQSDWDKVVARYNAAAQVIATDRFFVEFDESKFIVDWKDFRGCHTRDGAVSILQNFSDAFMSAVARGELANTDLVDLLKDVDTLTKATIALEEMLSKAPAVFGAQLDFLALINQVSPALGNLRSTAAARKKAIDKQLPVYRIRKDNLDSWIRQLRQSECSLAGAWAGTIKIEDMVYPMSLDIRGDPGQYSLTYAINGRTNSAPCVKALNPADRRIAFQPSCNGPSNSLLFSLDLSASYTSLSGLETDATDSDVRYPIAMQRR